MELRQLTYFRKACETGSLTDCARELFVTEQTVSAAIKKLEAELHCRLLVRGKKGVAPTPEGEAFLAKVVLAMGILEEGVRSVGQHKRAERARVRFEVVTFGIPEIGPFSIRALDTFAETFSDIDIEFSEHSTERCLHHVLEGVADLALVYDHPDDEQLDVIEIGRREVVAIMRADSPLADKELIDLEDFEGQTLLSAGQGGHVYTHLMGKFGEVGFTPAVRKVSSMFYFDATAEGRGIALALADHPMVQGNPALVAKRFSPLLEVTSPICLALHHDRRAGSPARLLASWLAGAWGDDDAG